MKTRVLTAHVPLPLAKKVDELSERLERPRGWIVKQALMAWIDQEEERRQMTLAAMEDVTAGRVVSHQDVRAWVAALDADKPRPVPSSR